MNAEAFPARLAAPWRRPSSARRAALRFTVFAALGLAAWYFAANGGAPANILPVFTFALVFAAAVLVRGLADPGPRTLLALARKTLRRV